MKPAMPALLGVMALTVSVSAQAGQKGPPPANQKVDQAKVDQAIRKGVEYLRSRSGDLGRGGQKCPDELVLLTLVHAGVSASDPLYRKLFTAMTERELESTYCVSLQAMVLEEVDRDRYQGRIWQCAQFLVDNQCGNGQWSYGRPVRLDREVPQGTPTGKETPTRGKRGVADFGGPPQKPAVVRTIPVTKRADGPARGDNSNSQYAALGLRACHDAGIVFPEGVVRQAQKHWRDSQLGEEGGQKEAYPSRGWNYITEAEAWGSMTAGAVASLVILDSILKEPWTKDPAVTSGMAWLARWFSVTEHPAARWPWPEHTRTCVLYYYLYALERAGMLYGTETLGRHEWYPEGAKVLLQAQRPDGSWVADACRPGTHCIFGPCVDTCFAILFLKRATRPAVASVDRFKK